MPFQNANCKLRNITKHSLNFGSRYGWIKQICKPRTPRASACYWKSFRQLVWTWTTAIGCVFSDRNRPVNWTTIKI